MKKFAAFILTLCFLLSLSACGKLSEQELTDSIPAMVVLTGSQRAAATRGGGDWNYKGQSLVIDALHPLQTMDLLSESSALSVSAGTEINMAFSVLPDSVTVTCWPASDAGSDTIPDGQTIEEVAFNNNLFSFSLPADGSLIVQARAEWNSYSDLSGTMDYSFLVHQ